MVSLLALGRGTAHAKESETPPDLSGTWSLNESKSQTLQQKIVNDQGERLYGSVINVDVCFRTKTPMDLGEGTVEAALQSGPRTAVARRPSSPEMLASAKPSLTAAPAPVANEPISAYAPVRDDRGAAFAGGRGLY